MKIAILADIHANLVALDAVIEHIQTQNVDHVIVAGDMIGRGPMGSQVLARIRAQGWPCIRGNHEDYILNFVRRNVPGHWLTSPEWSASRWMAANLGDAHLDFLDALPMTMTSPGPKPLRIFHGSPNSYQEGIGSWTPQDTLHAHLNAIDEDTLVCAHTHRPLHWTDGPRQIINVGSVGIPFNGDTRAQYATFTWTQDTWTPSFHQVDYDQEAFLQHYVTSGFLPEGGMTSALLRQEIIHARPFLVPFLVWARKQDLEPTHALMPSFLDIYDPTMSIRELTALLEPK